MFYRHENTFMRRAAICFARFFLVVRRTPAFAQDVRGLENCMAEKQIERRSGCLQANVEFLHQEIRKAALESRQKLAAAEKEIAAATARPRRRIRSLRRSKIRSARCRQSSTRLKKAKKDGK